MSTVDRGHAAERKWMKRLQDEGWFACRPRWAGVDVVAAKKGNGLVFYEVKSNKRGGPYMNFRTEDRALLKGAADKAGATPKLVWWPPGQEPQVIEPSAWPKAKPQPMPEP